LIDERIDASYNNLNDGHDFTAPSINRVVGYVLRHTGVNDLSSAPHSSREGRLKTISLPRQTLWLPRLRTMLVSLLLPLGYGKACMGSKKPRYAP
jgi:hypothetical protein